jgi:hypothetical protein
MRDINLDLSVVMQNDKPVVVEGNNGKLTCPPETGPF